MQMDANECDGRESVARLIRLICSYTIVTISHWLWIAYTTELIAQTRKVWPQIDYSLEENNKGTKKKKNNEGRRFEEVGQEDIIWDLRLNKKEKENEERKRMEKEDKKEKV